MAVMIGDVGKIVWVMMSVAQDGGAEEIQLGWVYVSEGSDQRIPLPRTNLS